MPFSTHNTDSSKHRREKIAWVDSAKGVGILLVVIGHTWRGLQADGLIADQQIFAAVDRAIYVFHMPLFFFMAGLFFNKTAEISNFVIFSKSKAIRLIYPLFIWTWIYSLLKLAMNDFVNSPLRLDDFPFFPLPPFELFWFLWALFVIQISLFLTFSVLNKIFESEATKYLAAFSVLAVLFLVHPYLGDSEAWLGAAVLNAPYLMLGVLMARMKTMMVSTTVGWIALGMFILVQVLTLQLPQTTASNLLLAVIAVLSISLVVMGAERLRPTSYPLYILRLLGNASMAVYVAHVIFSAGTRIVLSLANVSNLPVHVVLGTLSGVCGPLLLFMAARRLGISKRAGFE